MGLGQVFYDYLTWPVQVNRYFTLLMADKFFFPAYRYSLIICRNKANKFLAVEEKTGKWWIPGGKV
jgi:hypothetical protein